VDPYDSGQDRLAHPTRERNRRDERIYYIG
jgi:hypothetical protein